MLAQDALFSARDHLVRRGLLVPSASVTVTPLPGGVSSDIVAVRGGGSGFVVKRALPQLRVSQQWLADNDRVVAEAAALKLAGELRPGTVPVVIDLDEATYTLTLELAPDTWRNWRHDLLEGRGDTAAARELGRALAVWHGETADHARVPQRLHDSCAFVQLRIQPFYGAIASHHPDLAPRIDELARALLERRTCLVHGDFSPKNVLTGDHRVWVLDWEAAHVGDGMFDVAFLITHLILKTVHRPHAAAVYRDIATEFLVAYGDVPCTRESLRSALVPNVGCLMLARVDGKSPAEYLSSGDAERVRRAARQVLQQPLEHVLDIWKLV